MAKKRTKRQQKTVKNIGKILLAVGILTCFAIVISLGLAAKLQQMTALC